MLINEIMVKKVITLKPEDTLKEVVEKFSAHNISGAPVIDEEDKVIGIVSESDILNTLKRNLKEFRMVHLFPEMKMIGLSFETIPTDKKTEEVIKEVGDIKASDMMTKAMRTVGPKDNINAAIEILSSGKINRIPVVEDEKLVGIVTRGDIIKGMSKIAK
jgi:CBS domain-containing protein